MTGHVTIAGMLFSDPETGPAETLVAELRDYPEWHRGRERYGVWVLPIVQPALLDYVARTRDALSDLLHPSPHRQPHMTVFVCGFHQPRKRADDDFSPSLLRRQQARLRSHAGGRVALPLAKPDSFASAAFIPVDDREGRIAHWRALLGSVSDEVRQSAYVPHITLGLYRRRVDAPTIRRRLALLDAPPLALEATGLHYVTYAARDQLGPLRVHRRWPLTGSVGQPAGFAADGGEHGRGDHDDHQQHPQDIHQWGDVDLRKGDRRNACRESHGSSS